MLVGDSFAAQTTGGVNWIDPLGYQKPNFYPITVPDESSVSKYYVDMSNGSDSNSGTSSGSPCRTLSGLASKNHSPLRGGPAYIYLKGTGQISLTNSSLYGTSGNEIVIKPWPGASQIVNLRGVNNFESPNVRYLIIDGGPNLLFDMTGTTGYGEGNTNGMALVINSNYLTIARCRIRSAGGTGGANIARNGGNVTGTKFINNEFYDSEEYWAPLLYPGGGNSCSGSSTANDTHIINNIFRDAGPEAIEFNPRTLSDGVYITGNSFHNIGKNSCGTAWQCRPAVVIDGPSCGGQTRNVYIENNIMWDMGSGGIWDRGGSSAISITNNTIYDYGKGSGDPNPEGISGYSNQGRATINSNHIFSPSGINPFDNSNFSETNNMCADGKNCGSNSQTSSSSAAFLSTNPNSPDFLKIKSGSKAIDNGYPNSSTTNSYFGVVRDSSVDIGAHEYSTGSSTNDSLTQITTVQVRPSSQTQ